MVGVIASRNYYPGDVIFREEAFAKVTLESNKDVMCEWCCNMPLGLLKSCKECMAVKYCGKACQKSDWPTHRLECKHLKNLPKEDIADLVRLLGKVIHKIKNRDWKLIKKRILGKDFTFEDLDCSSVQFSKNPQMLLFFKSVKECLIKYIGVENVPDDECLMKLVGKVKHNAFKGAGFSFSFCLGVPQFDEECIPNSCLSMNGNEVCVWACKRIRKGIDKISLPTRPILSRRGFLASLKKEPCKCTDCSLPYGESILTKIIDEKRAYSVLEETEAMLIISSLTSSFRWDLEQIEELLEKQKEVLGRTNRLHLKLLALKCLEIGGHPLMIIDSLLELERNMESIFGEYYVEMGPIYETLSDVSIYLGDRVAAAQYARKAKIILDLLMP